MPMVSVIIPCFNQGQYLAESIGSVLDSGFADLEIIVVDDGSTDTETCRILNSLCYPGTKVLRMVNQGPSAARNAGIEAAEGRYILPLDADDRIEGPYLQEATELLEQHPEYRIVYCKGAMFGARQGEWPVAPFSLRLMLMGNLIFCSGLFRKADWQVVGGYNSLMTRGYEDWDFWLSLLELGGTAYRIPRICFWYRIKDVSRTTTMDHEAQAAMHLQIMRNHPFLFIEQAAPLVHWYYRLSRSWWYRFLKEIGLVRFIGRLVGR